ncbi:Imm26 family immunity protein [Cytophagaceae bacterium ABcell3]|nr:Imm26 family immunity protein [Cytophagaceae bacterium ABcell3]
MGRKKTYAPIGGVFKIKLENDYFIYGRIITSAWCAFYDFKTNKEIGNLEFILSKPIKYTTAVDIKSIGSIFEIIGELPLEDKFQILPYRAKPDKSLNPDGTYKEIYVIFEADGRMRVTENKEEVIGMEMPIVWSEENIQQILIDMYSGRTSPLKERYTIR